MTFAVALVTLCGTLAIVVLPSLRSRSASTRGVRSLGRSRRPRRRPGRRNLVDRRQRRTLDRGRRQADPGHAARAAGRPHCPRALSPAPLRVRRGPDRPALRGRSSSRDRPRQHRRHPQRHDRRIDDVRTVLLGMALFALGTRVHIPRLVRIGVRPLVLGLGSWALIAAVAYAACASPGRSRVPFGTAGGSAAQWTAAAATPLPLPRAPGRRRDRHVLGAPGRRASSPRLRSCRAATSSSSVHEPCVAQRARRCVPGERVRWRSIYGAYGRVSV